MQNFGLCITHLTLSQVRSDSFFHDLNLAMIVFSALGFVVRLAIGIRRNHKEQKADEQMKTGSLPELNGNHGKKENCAYDNPMTVSE